MSWREQLWWLQKIKKGPRWLQIFTGWFFFLNPIFSLPLIYYLIYPFVKLEETKILGYVGIFVFLFVTFRYSLWGYWWLKGEKYPFVKLNRIKSAPKFVQKSSRRLQIFLGCLCFGCCIFLLSFAVYLISVVRGMYLILEYLVILIFAFLIAVSFLKGIMLIRGRESPLEKSTIGWVYGKFKEHKNEI